MVSTSIQPAATAIKSTITPVTTLEGHEGLIESIAYFPDNERLMSGSLDGTARRWDLQASDEIEKVPDIYEQQGVLVAVSKDGRWVVTAGHANHDGYSTVVIKACEVKTGLVKKLETSASAFSTCIDISADSTLLAIKSTSPDVPILNLETDKLVVVRPFESPDEVGAIRFSQDSKKLAMYSVTGTCLDVWDIQTQKLDARVRGKRPGTLANGSTAVAYLPVFWTAKGRTIVAGFNFADDSREHDLSMIIYEFDASTLGIVGVPFKGHELSITGLALSYDCALLISASYDITNLWAFESRQLLASFDIHPYRMILSPYSRQLAYTTYYNTGNTGSGNGDHKIYICNIPPDILASIRPAQESPPIASTLTNPRFADQLNSNATSRSAILSRNPTTLPVISLATWSLRPPPIIDPQQPAFFRYFRTLFHSSFGRDAVPQPEAASNNEPRDPLDFPATSRLLPHASPSAEARSRPEGPLETTRPIPAPSTTQSSITAPTTFLHRLSTWWPIRGRHTEPPIVDVPLTKAQLVRH
ncbi:WD40 repeat-like protein [Rhizopogon vinicolor AM-OR11-026]|uniref:WD40 repeat-like protein n=1 Tax=Rhizopogon vinicolor AM-OR11-026 TaxID=1314800 RepID=A0A1B7N9W4_9AGAM|nr:WD40 repeat-like protein [Rhizopogon vinicolor AM-OR11-026]